MTDQKDSVDASAFHPEVLRLFDGYVHGLIPRRDFLRGASAYAALMGATALELLDALNLASPPLKKSRRPIHVSTRVFKNSHLPKVREHPAAILCVLPSSMVPFRSFL